MENLSFVGTAVLFALMDICFYGVISREIYLGKKTYTLEIFYVSLFRPFTFFVTIS